MLKLDRNKQAEIVQMVSETFTNYEEQTAQRRARMTRIYESASTFQINRTKPRQTNFKVNKLHEIENRILPRIMSKNPKAIVSYKSYDYIVKDFDVSKVVNAVQDRIDETYSKQDMTEILRLRTKAMIRYGIWFVKISPKYRIKRTQENDIEYNEEGEEVPTKKVKEDVYETYAWIDIKSRTDMYFDPRYTRLEDMPSIIDITKNARLSYFTRNKGKYMNVDKLIDCCIAWKDTDSERYKNRIYAITGIQSNNTKIIKPNTLDIKCFYGLYDVSDDDSMRNERLYEFWTVDDVLLIYAKEITTIPFEDIRCFEDTETYFATWYLEPILGIQDELNFKKNKASEYINKTLNPDMIRSPMSGIDPRKLNQWHGNIIVTNKDWETALANIPQIPRREVNGSYFQEQNDFERQIQAATFTVNTNSPLTQSSLTNTATWAKIQAFETDAVTGDTRKHVEEWIVRLTYKLLQFDYDNNEWEIWRVKKRKEDDSFWQIHKEALRDAISKYEIKIEAGSSSFDSEESRRNDALAKRNIGLQAKQWWLPVNMKKLYEGVLETFQWYDAKDVFEQVPMAVDTTWWVPWSPEWQTPPKQANTPPQIPTM